MSETNEPQNPTQQTEPTPNEPAEPKEPTPKEPEEKHFTQADIDRIVKDRLDREKKKRDDAVQAEKDEAERKRLESEQQFKALYEKTQEELDKARKAEKTVRVEQAKTDALVNAGYKDEQLKDLREFIHGEDDEAIKEAVEKLKKISPPKQPYADPSAGNGAKHEPAPKDKAEEGRSLYKRLKAAGKIRGGKQKEE